MAKVKGKKNKLLKVFILDRSGSMDSIGAREVCGTVNASLAELRKEDSVDVSVIIVQFDTGSPFEMLRKCVPLKQCENLTESEYSPRGGTPLYDAIGKTLNFIDNEVVLSKGERVVVTVFTDGYENSSLEFNAGQIKEMLTSKQRNKDWMVTYLGANQDAWTVGASLGFNPNLSATYVATAQGMNIASSVTMNKVGEFASTGKAQSYSDDERKSLTDG